MSHSFNQRGVFNNAVKSLIAAGQDPAKAILSQSYLRLEVVANTSTTNYQFGVLVNDIAKGGSQVQAVRPTEQRLNLQDAFYVGSVQMLIGLATSTTDTAFPLYTWNNPLAFSTSGASTALNNLYNGAMSLTVNNRIITPAWDLARHKYVPQTQQGVGGGGTGFVLPTTDQENLGIDSAFPAEPNWVLIGSKNNTLNFNLPASIGTLQASATTVFTLILRGVLAQNVTVVS